MWVVVARVGKKRRFFDCWSAISGLSLLGFGIKTGGGFCLKTTAR